jgi:TolB-like protein/DNA-binding winged helix-turn-helix (wHTH) protein/Tfp pilus assembly protein PilF
VAFGATIQEPFSGGSAMETVRGTVRFGAFEVDLRTEELRKHGLTLRLPHQSFQILTLLLRYRGELVSREELREKLWPVDTFVDFDHGLNAAVNRLREALGDSTEKPRFIETLPRRGYRFIGQVTDTAGADGSPRTKNRTATSESSLAVQTPAAASSPPVTKRGMARPAGEIHGTEGRRLAAAYAAVFRSNLYTLLAVTTLVVVAGTAVYLWLQRRSGMAGTEAIRSLAVLPLEDLSRDPAQEYFAEGMTDELITSLAHIQTLKIISRSSVVRYKGTNKPLREIARELDVDGVIEGTVLRSGNRVRITAQLIRASTDQHLWAETYEGNVEDVLRLQDAVARAIVAEIRVKLGPEEEARLAKTPSVNPAAYEAYLRGRYDFYDRWNKAGFVSASHYFEEAIAKDPKYAPAYAGLADYYTLSGFMERPLTIRESMDKARELAAKALQLDDGLADAHIAMANVLFRYDWNWAEAEKEFRRGIELNPNAPSSYLHYAMYLGVLGRFDEGIAATKRAIELDPFSALACSSLGVVLEWAGRTQEAEEQERKAIALDPFFPQPHLVLANVYERLGRHDDATVEHLEADALEGIDPPTVAGFRRAYMSFGVRGYQRKRLEWEKQRIGKGKANYFRMAKLSADLSDKNAAFDWLEKACQERSHMMPNIKVAAELLPLHGDPRFADLVRRVGFP